MKTKTKTRNNNNTQPRWIFFLARRYILKRGSGTSAASLLAMLEIAAGVLALTVIIAVMNGFQLGFIESILEISSYYVRVDNLPVEVLRESGNAGFNSGFTGRLKQIEGVTAAVPFKESEGILKSKDSGAEDAVVLRGLPEDVLLEDPAFASHIKIMKGGFDSSPVINEFKNSVLCGGELARRLSLIRGDEVDFISISSIFNAGDEGEGENVFFVEGAFVSGYYEYDLKWAFVNLERLLEIEKTEGGRQTVTLGIKLKDRYKDLEAKEKIDSFLTGELGTDYIRENGIVVHTWRDYNKSFFGALRTEKLLMFVLVGLIFIVVALNIFQSQRRIILEKSKEIGLLRAIGGGQMEARCVFTLNGLLIGFTGASFGMALALLIATHIKGFFAFIELVVNSVLLLFNNIVLFFAGGYENIDEFALFNRRIFYLQDIPARLIAGEVVLIYLFGLLSAVVAAWFASKRISRIKPAEALRYE